MTEEQAATTQAPTTQAPTTQASSNNVEAFLESLVDNKLTAVFEDNRPNKGRNHLLQKWKKLLQKYKRRYNSMENNDCSNFDDTYDDNSVDFNSINACRDINRVADAFKN